MSAQSPRRSGRRRWLGVLSVVVFVGLVVASVLAFESPNDSRAVSGDADLRDGIRIGVNVVKVVPEEEAVPEDLQTQAVAPHSRSAHGARGGPHPRAAESSAARPHRSQPPGPGWTTVSAAATAPSTPAGVLWRH